ncbi:hypothetical protein [Massilia soli]|uniref:Uncharacterized protein n=1 Tax=Massilia soli TaxID=2792854 RepID=A0ABS7SVW9_9BURK|nr:hypothetical protein [Massilia soli]MBZ2210074.1 hypothetical protein [Massilia soli]
MNFQQLLSDTITVVKRNGGARFEGIKAAVQSEEISILQSQPFIEPNDLILRSMSNGGEETFVVLDPGFHEGLGRIPAGYRARVRKMGLPEAQSAVQSIIYNVTGSNARINNHSVDNSINLVQDNSGEVAQLLAELRRSMNAAQLPPADRDEALEIIDGVESQFTNEKPKRSIVRAMLNALPHVANVATTIGALVSLAG